MTSNPSTSAVDVFRGDFGMLASMMQLSWADNHNESLLYSEAFLRSAFEYPGSSFDLAPTVYGDAGPLGFVAGFPRSVLWDGRQARFVLSCFLTASAAVKGAGIGLKLWSNLIQRCRDRGFDGVISYCVEGDDMDRILPGLSSLLKLNTERIFSVKFLVRLLRPAPPEPLPPVSGEDVDLFLELAAALPGSLPLLRQWTREEAEWQCRNRAGAITVSSRVDDRCGILTGYLIQQASTPPVTVVLLENLLWGNLEPPEQVRLLERFLALAAAQGARLASCPVLGYASMNPLVEAGFRSSKRVIHTYLTPLKGLELRPVSAVYIDVF